jgi:hypothetical protein
MHGLHCRRIVAALALSTVVVLEGSTAVWAWTTAYGHVGARDRTFRSGCHRYRYHYVVKPPSDDWILQTWLYDPRGRPRGSGDFLAGSDPRRGRSSFGICRSTVVPGRFTITARISWYTPGLLPVDPPVEHHRWFKPAHFRLHR